MFERGRDRKKVKKVLSTLDAYTRHFPYRKKYPRERVMTSGINVQMQADLIDLQSLSKANDSYRFVLIVIDVFSKYIMLVPVKSKTASDMVEAVENVFKQRTPLKFQSDQGSEFMNRSLQTLFKDYGVEHFYTRSDLKSSIVERAIRTIKNVMYRYFTRNKTLRYIDVLDQIALGYNRTYHTSIGMAPIDVNYKNQEDVFQRLYATPELPKSPGLIVGSTVRISKIRGVFSKSALASYTEEIFYIAEAIPGNPPTYRLRDYDGEILEGRFYRQELLPIVKEDDIFKVERVLKTRKKGKRTEYFVKWLGYPTKFNSWVSSFV